MATTAEKQLSMRTKILVGGLGALTPIIINLLMVDLEKLLIQVTPISIISYIIKVIILFYLGGIVAYFNKDENKPFKLFQLGIYAPALIITLMNAAQLKSGSSNTIFPANPQAPTQEVQKPQKLGPDTTKKPISDISPVFPNKQISAAAQARNTNKQAVTFSTNTLQSPEQRNTLSTQDTTLYQFSYPPETYSEQFLRGFLGWKSERIYFVIAAQFTNKEDAFANAQLINTQLKQYQQLVANKQALTALVFKPNTAIPNYCVVMAKNVTLSDAQDIVKNIIISNIATISASQIIIWKLPDSI